jgi:hypothetical protein
MLRYPSEVGSGDFVTLTPHEYRSNASGANGPPVGPPIMIYMPNSTPAMRNGQTWQSESFQGPMGALGRDVSAGIVSLVNPGGADTGRNTIDHFKSAIGNVGGAVQHGITTAAAGIAGKTANQMLAYTKGQIYNPNVELLYDGPAVRQFDFNFNFIPKDPIEASLVAQIILQFKIWSSPEDQGQKYKVPAVWSVKYGGAGGTWMNRFKRAAMTNIGVQYNAGLDMHATFSNGFPLRTDIQLSFQEVDVITRKDHMTNPFGGGY